MDADFASGLTNVICKDGQTTITANLPMAGFRHTGAGAATAAGHYARVNEVQDGSLLYGGTAGGTADALTIATVPTFTAYATGMALRFKSGASPNTGAATLQANGIASPKAIQLDGAALAAGQIEASKFYDVIYDGTAFQLSRASSSSPIGPFVDTNPVVVGSADATKKLRFEVDGLTAGTTRVATPPDYDHRVMSQTHCADIASAGTVNLDTATGDLVDVTGTTTITAITLADGKCATVRFTGILTLTNGASLVLPGAANIPTQAGDIAVFRGYAAGVVRCVSYSSSLGALRSVQTFTGSGTYTKPAGLRFALVKVQAPGGGGGGADSDGTGIGAAGGGGAGGYAEELLAASAIAATETVTIGAIGAAGTNTGTNGGTGGTTSFGSLLQATGGIGGTGTGLTSSAAAKAFSGGAGGAGSGGTVNAEGGDGGDGWVVTTMGVGGAGGASRFGAQGRQVATTTDSAGVAGNNYGGGGTGGITISGNTAGFIGGAGGSGIIYVYEYY